MTTPIDQVLSGLRGVRRNGDGWMACCPAHNDTNPSLSINIGEDGRVLLRCFVGCETEQIVATLGLTMADLFPPREDPIPHSNGRGPRASGNGTMRRLPAPWPGLTLAQYALEKLLDPAWLLTCGLSDFLYVGKPAVRFSYLDTSGSEAAVRFRVAMEKGDGWDRFKWQKGASVSLYGLDRLPLARERGYVVVPEGESDTHTLWHYDEPAMGIPGADNWKESRDAPLLVDIPTIYVPIEPDQGGQALRQRLTGSAIAFRVRVVDLSPFGVKDVSALHCADSDRFAERWQAAKDAAVPLLMPPVAVVADVVDAQGDEGSSILDEVADFLERYIAYPSEHARVAHTLWVAHTHAMDAWDSTPRLAFLSPEPASGKTRGLEVTELLVPRPVETINVSAAYLFRKVDDPEGSPTILFDEIDTVFGPKAREHEDVRGLLNAGHRKGAVAGRCVVRGKTVEIEEFPAYCAVAIAGLGDLPDTILTRSVVIHMRRRAKSERVEPFRRRIAVTPGHVLRDRVATWVARITPQLLGVWPEMPAGVEDRDADVWEALLAVADAAGGEWPTRARAAAVALVAQSKVSTPSLGIRLLADLRTVFGDRDAMTTDAVLSGLQGMPEAPWAELVGGRPLNPRGLANRLLGYGITPKSVRVGEKVLRGYARADLADAWERYLPPVVGPDGADPPSGREDAAGALPPRESATSATSATPNPGLAPNNQEIPQSDAVFGPESSQAHLTPLVAAMPPLSATASTASDAARTPVVDVADVADGQGDGERCSVETVAPTFDTDRHMPARCGALNSCRLLGPCAPYREHGRCWNDRD